ncbi:alginate lyase family protein [Paenibacillus sp. HWE-109]|uniref:alginate lyase family protein n=1 Tax=Paenibacillus sp. HWE-109 TaxID=1306526 RepID=UPI001EE05C3F|nr:alginate lyase family protein [Paenibacillus sp. HWE-109]UKS28508.1 alginate lyase family protein [Paenibacillus sp. HWE-109]
MSRKYSLKQVVVSFLCGSLFFSGIGFAASSSTDISLKKVRLFVDGVNKSAPNGNYNNQGDKVPESLVYQNTTYVPVRMVGELMGKNVEWDTACRAIIIGSKPSDEVKKAACKGTEALDDAKLVTLDAATLNEAKRKYLAGDPLITQSVNQLILDAEAALQKPPVSVLDKTTVAPSGDKHDYVSIGVYWWPNPNTPDGKPYIQKDGQQNPEVNTNAFDRTNFGITTTGIRALSLAYFFTENEAYADYASKLLRIWYLDPATRMNPSLNYGQSVPGVNEGRAAGIIETLNILNTLDPATILNGTKYLSNQDLDKFKQWIGSYMTWLLESPIGTDERNAKNNHGNWYDAQVTAYALFSGHTDVAKKIVEDNKKRIASQIAPDGSMPLELARTRSLHYSTYNMEAMTIVARLGSKIGIDLWNYKTEDGRSILKAMEFLSPYISKKKEWEFEQIKAETLSSALPAITSAARAYKNPEFRFIAEQLLKEKGASARENLVFTLPSISQ